MSPNTFKFRARGKEHRQHLESYPGHRSGGAATGTTGMDVVAPLEPLQETIFSCFLRGAPTPVFALPMVGRGGAGGEGGISQQLPRVGENYLCLGVRGGEVYNHGRGQLDSSTFIFL